MIKHAFKLVWQRKRQNLLIILEMLFTFLILFSLTGFSLNFYRLYSQPLGFRFDNVWNVFMSSGQGEWKESDSRTVGRLLEVLGQMEEVEEAHTIENPPFVEGGWGTGFSIDGQQFNVQANVAGDGLPAALGMRLLEGRWYGPEDDGQAWRAVVVNRAMRDEYGGEGSLVGRFVGPEGRPWRIVGVFESFRQYGEFSVERPYMIQRETGTYNGVSLVLVLKPGVTASFEEKLINTLQAVAPGWRLDAVPWTELRASHHRLFLRPLFVAAVLVGFLLLMVGLGLLGVLWQNIIRRGPEIGLRRAMGAPAGKVRLQVVLELLALAALSLALGLLIVVQFPLTGLIEALDWPLFTASAIMSAAILLGLCVLFALYPSFQATRKDPVEALRYE